jgi:hypothetical protein
MTDLPRPVSVTDFYLAAILAKLDELGQSPPIEYSVEVDPNVVVLKEPEKPEPVYTLLPDDFPGKDALEEAGVIYLEDVPQLGADLVEIPGIGRATANKILTWFKT